MTKEKFIICASVAFLGAILNFFSKSNKHAGLKISSDLVIGMFLLLLITSSFKIGNWDIEIDEGSHSDYEKISEDMISKVVLEVSEKIEETIVTDVCAEFGISNVKSNVVINCESFEVEKATVYISNSEKAISNYNIKMYLKQKYDIDIEVLNC